MSSVKSSRIETLDWLRGLMALSIMFYHLTIWIIAPQDSSSPLGRLGVYGVSIFFVLSGLSMAIVYNKYIDSINKALKFFVRRIFRILPLMIAASTLVILPEVLRSGKYDWWLYFINITTLFGFIEPTSYIPVGAWSIGNEMVYYALTPVIIIIYNYKKWAGNILLVICIGIGSLFAFYLMKPDMSISDQWALYVNPFNNLFLYVIGIAIYYNFKDITISPIVNIMILLIASALFCFLPYEGNQMSIVTGHGRIVFVLLSSIIVLCFYKLKVNLPGFLSNILETFGIATYGVYLVHPIVYFYVATFLNRFNIRSDELIYGMVMVLTITISVISYKLFELRMIKLGKKLTS